MEIDRIAATPKPLATGFASFDADGHLVEANAEMLAPAGIDAERVAGGLEATVLGEILAGFDEIRGFDPADPDRIPRAVVAWARPAAQLAARCRDGGWRLLSNLQRPGGARCYLSVDITASEHERALHRRMLDELPVPVIAADAESGVFTYVNDDAIAMAGTRPENAPWVTMKDFFVLPDQPRRIARQLEEDGRSDLFDVPVRTPDGRQLWASGSARQIEFDGRSLVLGALFDVTDRHGEGREEQRAQELLNDAIESLGEGVALYREDDTLALFNHRFRDLLDPDGEVTALGRDLMGMARELTLSGSLLPPEGTDAETFAAMLVDAVHAERKDLEIAIPEGRRLRLSSHKSGLHGHLITVEDITRRKRSEERTLAVLTDVVQALDIGVALLDADLRYVFGNQKAAELFFSGIAPPHPGEPAIDVVRRMVEANYWSIPADMPPEVAIDKLMQQIRDYAKNFEIRPAEGGVLNGSVHATDLGGYLLVISDITDRQQAEIAQREADELVRTIVEASPTTFLVSRVDDGKIIYCPPASLDRFGHLETTLGFWVSEADRERYLEALLRTGSLNDYPVRFRRGDGSIMDGLTSARVIELKGEQAIVSSTRDITEHLAMEAELERQREIAHQNEKLSALGELLAGVAHELNNPLSIVVGYALMLQDKVEDPALKRRVDRIGQAAERCAKIVRTFLAMARQRPAIIERCQLNDIVEMALDVAGYGLRAGGVEIDLQLDPDLPAADADPDQMAQVFTNLLVNAEHALAGRKEAGRLVLRSFADRSTGEVVVEISDNGEGIPQELQSRIFEPFFTTKEVGTGTGVGLAFCHRIIDSHGGRLSVRSMPGKGASFFVRLKAASGEAEATEDETVPAPVTARRQVLVVDDEPGVSELIADVLEEHGCEVHMSGDAAAALAMIGTRDFDAVLSDFRMPGMDGASFLSEVIARHPTYLGRIAIVTGDAMSQRVAAFLKSTNCRYLEKPVVPHELVALVKLLCDEDEGA